MPDLSDNCQMCGANPHEECRMKGPDHLAINCPNNLAAHDSRKDDMREHTMVEHLDEGHPTQLIIRRSEELKRKAFDAGWHTVVKMNPRLPKEGAIDGVLARNPNPPTMNAGMPRDPDLLARLKRMYGDNPMKKPKKDD